MDVWEWITTTTSFNSVLTTLGLGVLAFLYARDLILSRGQHLRRIQDLVDYHEKVLLEKDARILDLKQTVQDLQVAVTTERGRADKATEAVGGMVEAIRTNNYILESLDSAVKGREDER